MSVPDIFYTIAYPNAKRKNHVIARTIEKGVSVITYKWYSYVKKRWNYEAATEFLLSHRLRIEGERGEV